MNYIVHYKIVYQNRSFDSVTTVRDAASTNDARMTVARMVQATAPTSIVEITGVKETSEEDFNKLIQLIKIS